MWAYKLDIHDYFNSIDIGLLLPMLKEMHIGAINWGFVAGKTQTFYPWGSQEGSEEPEVWFHDILRSDGTPFSEEEVRIIKHYTGK